MSSKLKNGKEVNMPKTTRKLTIELLKVNDCEKENKLTVITLWHGRKPIADLFCYDKAEVRITKLSLYYLVGVSIGNNNVTFRAEVLEDLRSEK